jgi:hypothetical protein
MGVGYRRALELSKMEDQKSLTLHWRSLLGGGSNIVAGNCAHTGGQYTDYGVMLSHRRVIIQDARLEIGDAPLTLISRMGQRAYCLPLFIWPRPKTLLWIDVTMKPFDCRNDQRKIVDAPLTLRWRSVDAHLGDILTVIGRANNCLIFKPSFLTANIWFQGIIMCIQKHRGLSVSAPPVFTSSVR